MASIILPRKWTTQPSTRVEPSNPRTTSLLLPYGGRVIECANYGAPSAITTFGTAPTDGAGRYGRAIQASGGGLIIANHAAYLQTDYTVTIACEITAVDASYGGLFAVSNSDGTARFGLQRSGATNNFVVFHDNSTPAVLTSSSITEVIAGFSIVTISYTSVGKTLKYYLNGNLVQTVFHTRDPTSPSSSRLVLFSARDALANYGSDGKIYLVSIQNYQRSDSDVLHTHKNVWREFADKKQVLYFDTAAGGATVAPSTGAVSFAGSAPTISQPQTVAPGAGAEVYAGQVPSIAQAVSITPTDGAVSFAGSAPTISQPQTVAPGAGAEVYAGQVPEISQAASVRPDAGAVSFAGSAPTISQPQTLATVTGSVVLEGLAPAVTQGVSVSPGAGSEVVLGYVPALIQGSGVQPVDGAVTVAGFAPTIGQPHTIVTVTGAYAILGTAPTITQAAILSPTDGAVGVDGYTPAIAQPRTITTIAGAATWSGFTPGIGSPVEFAKYLAGVRVYHTDADAVVKHTTSSTRVPHT